MNEKMKTLLQAAGVKVTRVVVLGKFVHIDTFKNQESKLRTILSMMKAKEIKVLEPAADGGHIDGVKAHRIVATF